MTHELTVPFAKGDLAALRVYDRVLVSGFLLVGRDQVHKRFVQLLADGLQLPVDLEGQLLYYMGPAATPPGLPIGSCGPTTAARMDRFWPVLMEHGLLATMGKGPRDARVSKAVARHGGLYLAAYGGCGALYASKVRSVETLAFADLGPEALFRLEVRDFPAIVAIDSRGDSVFR